MSINDSLSDLAATLSTELPLLRAAVSVADLAGASWPDAPVVGQLRFRTDLGLLCYYDGTRWLTANEYEANFTSLGASPLTSSGAAYHYAPRIDYSYYITNSSLLILPGSVNDASNYWRIGFSRGTTYIEEFSTAGYTIGVRALITDIVNTLYVHPFANTEHYFVLAYKVGSASNLYVTGTFRYRLVIP